ncbi:hypothetical protein OAK75_05940 [Bacteriovoracales bacterium]|nr:hypothetical protein [Bacteriovoracales bacterium]
MKYITNYLDRLGVRQVMLGVLLNTNDCVGVRFWNESGDHISIDEVPIGLEEGVFFFSYRDGRLTIIDSNF